MSKKSEEFSLDVPVDKAASACKQAIEDLGWKTGDVESNRIVAKVGFGAIRNPAQHEILLSEDGKKSTGVQLNSKILQVGPIAKSKLRKQADELREAIRAAV